MPIQYVGLDVRAILGRLIQGYSCNRNSMFILKGSRFPIIGKTKEIGFGNERFSAAKGYMWVTIYYLDGYRNFACIRRTHI